METILLQFIINVLLICFASSYSRDKYTRLMLYVFPVLAILFFLIKLLFQLSQLGITDPASVGFNINTLWPPLALAVTSWGMQIAVNKIILPNIRHKY